MSLNRLVLVLNASYEPIHVCSARRAIKLVLKGSATVEECSGATVHTPALDLPVPSVIRLRVYRRVLRLQRVVSRKGVLLRDGSACQYCGARLPARDLTLDHVIPRSRAGASTWENLVACCFPCNGRKGNRTPQEAGMPLLRQPKPIGVHARHRLMSGDDDAWSKYLFC
ncbi:MAG TPA: HNH endonuclease [Candidatus Solibacter sp.]|nr:HNH endonuclease [Candidatus Solibacter sp.]